MFDNGVFFQTTRRTMIIYDNKTIPQGSDAWLKIRLGIPTTSSFAKIITPTGKKSSQFSKYLQECLTPYVFGRAQDIVKTPAMMRGNELEPQAVEYYEYYAKVKTQEVGFITSDDGMVGCSPDRFVGKDGLLEVKCPLENQHTINLASGKIDSKYIPQVQGQMLLSGRKWCDWMSYHPDAPASIVRIEPDLEYQEKLTELLDEFTAKLSNQVNDMKGKGIALRIELPKRD